MRSALLACLLALGAHARPCHRLALEGLRGDHDPAVLLRDQARLLDYAREVEAHADAVFVDPNADTRYTLALRMRSRTGLGEVGCDEGGLFSSAGDGGWLLRVEHRPLGIQLHVLGLGRLDAASIFPEDEAADRDGLTMLGGGLGVGGQITEWFAFAVTRVKHAALEEDEPGWREVLDEAPINHSYTLFELGVPKLNLLARFTEEGEAPRLYEAQIYEVPLFSEDLYGTISGREVPVEARRALTSKLLYVLDRRGEMTLGVGAEVAAEDQPNSLRHLRFTLENVLAQSRLKRSRFSQVGFHARQHLALTMHRGARMRAYSDTEAAFGAEWRVEAGLQARYVYFLFDFGMSFNKPEMFELMPYAVNRGMLEMGLNVASRF